MHGFRWQLIALLLSVTVFGAALLTRLSNTPAPQPVPPTATATITPSPPPATTPGANTAQTRATQQPTANDPLTMALARATDGVPTFTEALIGNVTRLNPLLANDTEANINALLYEGLTRINAFGEPTGALALDWVVSTDGREYVFTLRDDALWHDGTPFTSADVIYTFSLLADADFPGDAQLAAFWRTVEVQAISQTLVRFYLAQPLSKFPTLLTIGILPEHALRGTTAAQLVNHPFNLTPIGTGPYQLEGLRASTDQRINAVDLIAAPVYQQRADYPGGFALQRVRFRLADRFEQALTLLENGIVDGLAARNMAERLALVNITGTQRYTAIAPTVGILLYNWDEGDDIRFFKDARVRNALQQCVNRITPVESRLANRAIPASSPLLPGSWAYADALAWPQPDTDAGRELLANANIQTRLTNADAAPNPDTANAVVNRFTILAPADPALQAIAQEIATQWSGCNLDVSVEVVAADTLQARLASGEFDVAMAELPLGADPDVFAYWHVGQHPDGENYGAVADDRISELLERARHETNGINRTQLYRQFQQLFVLRAIALPLYYPLYTYAVNERIQGVQLGFISTPADRFRTINQWTAS